MSQTNDELKREFEKVVDLLVQIESARESISSLLKDIKAEYNIEIPVARRVANVMALSVIIMLPYVADSLLILSLDYYPLCGV